jgi:uncharacterized membrane protein
MMSMRPAEATLPAGSVRSSPRGTIVAVLLTVVLVGWLLATPGGLLGKADAIGYAVCHRIDLRSFHLGERALPLCSRCTGMFLGTLATLAYFVAARRGRATHFPSRPIVALLGVFGVAFAIDGLNSYLHFFPSAPTAYEPSNFLRLTTGLLLGIALGNLVYPGFNQVAWRSGREAPALQSSADLVRLLALAAALAGLVLSENPLVLYPLALLSSLGVVLLLTLVYAMLILLLVRRENQAESWRDLALPLAGGLTLAFGQLGALDLLRYLVTGTWNGFSL